jgi:transcriptional regulator with XRE-family HTH domain
MVVTMNDRQILGAYIKDRRNSRGITVRAMADMIDMGYGLYGDMESGRRCPADLETLDRIIEALRLPEDESKKLYDLAGKAREAAPPDLTSYINNTNKARVALRVAKEKATDEDWERFTQYLESKGD